MPTPRARTRALHLPRRTVPPRQDAESKEEEQELLNILFEVLRGVRGAPKKLHFDGGLNADNAKRTVAREGCDAKPRAVCQRPRANDRITALLRASVRISALRKSRPDTRA